MTGANALTHAVTVRRAGPEDAAALLALHRAGFGGAWQLRHWRWRFVDNPLRRTEIVGAFTPDGRCLASFCGVPLPCRYDGEPALVHTGSDVVVHPRLRESWAGAKLLLRVANGYCEAFGRGAVRVAYGFPAPALCRVLTGRCHFEVLDEVAVLVGDAFGDGDRSHGAGTSIRTTITTELPADLEEVSPRLQWHRGAHSGIVRDRAYLQWRYGDNPHATYHFVVARTDAASLRGLAVVRTRGAHDDTAVVAEWLVADDDAAAARALLAAVKALARHDDLPHLAFAFAAGSAQFARFQRELGFRVVKSAQRFVFRTFHPDVDRGSLLRGWQLSLGELDCI